jgi:hypothetical protein
MFMQPFFVSERKVMCCDCTVCNYVFDPRSPLPSYELEPFGLTIGMVDDFCFMSMGIAGDPTATRFFSTGWMPRLVLLDSQLELLREFQWPSRPLLSSSSSVTRTHDRFWFALQCGEFESKLGWMDDATMEVHFPEVKTGSEGPDLEGFPIVLAHHGKLVLFNDVAGTLSWLDDNGNVTRRMSISPGAVVGPCVSGDLILAFPSDADRRVCLVDASASIVPVSDMRIGRWKETEGLCMAAGRVFALDTQNTLHFADTGSADWHVVSYNTDCDERDLHA